MSAEWLCGMGKEQPPRLFVRLKLTTAAALVAGANILFPQETQPTSAQSVSSRPEANLAVARVGDAIAARDASAILAVLSEHFVSGIYTGASESPSGQRVDQTTAQLELIKQILVSGPECLRWEHFPGSPERAILLFNNFPQKDRVGFLTLEKENSGWKVAAVNTIDWGDWEKFVRDEVDGWDGCPRNSSSGSENTKRPKFEELLKEHKVFSEGRTRYVFVEGITSVIFSGGVGSQASRLGLDFIEENRTSRGINGGTDLIFLSWGGWRIDPRDGLFYLKDQSCQDTLRDPHERSLEMVEFLKQWFAYHPNDRLVVSVHSEGAQPALMAMEEIMVESLKNPYYPLDPGKVDFIFTHAAVLGVNKGGLVAAFTKVFKKIPDDCVLGFTGIPVPAVLDQPTGRNLVQVWERRVTRSREIEQVVKWWESHGSGVRFIGNLQDEAFLEWGWLGDGSLGILLKIDKSAREKINTQRVPGAKGDLYYLGHKDYGHTPVWTSSQGRAKLAGAVWHKSG